MGDYGHGKLQRCASALTPSRPAQLSLALLSARAAVVADCARALRDSLPLRHFRERRGGEAGWRVRATGRARAASTSPSASRLLMARRRRRPPPLTDTRVLTHGDMIRLGLESELEVEARPRPRPREPPAAGLDPLLLAPPPAPPRARQIASAKPRTVEDFLRWRAEGVKRQLMARAPAAAVRAAVRSRPHGGAPLGGGGGGGPRGETRGPGSHCRQSPIGARPALGPRRSAT